MLRYALRAVWCAAADESRVTRLVLIGKNLDDKQIVESFNAAMHQPDLPGTTAPSACSCLCCAAVPTSCCPVVLLWPQTESN